MKRRKQHSCAACERPIVGGKTGYCCHCYPRLAHPGTNVKYPWTREWDRLLCDAYNHCLVGKPTAAINKLQSITGYPRYIVRLRAQRLGISRDRRRPWTASEIAFLREHAGKISTRAIARALYRSWESVAARMDVERLSAAVTAGYSMQQLAGVIGCEPHQVRRWIQSGWLTLNEDRRIPEFRVRSFLAMHIDSIDLRLCNQKWLKDRLRALMMLPGRVTSIAERRTA